MPDQRKRSRGAVLYQRRAYHASDGDKWKARTQDDSLKLTPQRPRRAAGICEPCASIIRISLRAPPIWLVLPERNDGARCQRLVPEAQLQNLFDDRIGLGQDALRHRNFQSITVSAATSRVSGTFNPSVFAVLRLITSSNLLGCRNGSSAGLAPAKIRPT